ncbi:hypothetical protein BZA05DRAFT_410791 [Tricharina praecox]|uniref:uncharacterized protein n=1 Tax=Tricharina praecox TaxID=43433 RepID=UPI00221EE693|nr:uncharacterized protein BZA05DRAFT_410791 [Tricharina praecox]KAI5843627.1 hypothetical protein BZA05DRAFT_410791 [Tricharina praecox]
MYKVILRVVIFLYLPGSSSSTSFSSSSRSSPIQSSQSAQRHTSACPSVVVRPSARPPIHPSILLRETTANMHYCTYIHSPYLQTYVRTYRFLTHIASHHSEQQ